MGVGGDTGKAHPAEKDPHGPGARQAGGEIEVGALVGIGDSMEGVRDTKVCQKSEVVCREVRRRPRDVWGGVGEGQVLQSVDEAKLMPRTSKERSCGQRDLGRAWEGLELVDEYDPLVHDASERGVRGFALAVVGVVVPACLDDYLDRLFDECRGDDGVCGPGSSHDLPGEAVVYT